MSDDARTYRFGDANRPGLLLGLGPRQALPLLLGVVWLAVILQTSVPAWVGVLGPVAAVAIAFGRWRGSPLAEVLVPGLVLLVQRHTGHARWTRPPLLGDQDATLPRVMRGLDLIDVSTPGAAAGAFVRDRRAGTLTGLLRVSGRGFPLASNAEQDTMVSRWGAALSPFARERSPVVRVAWQEWAHPVRLSIILCEVVRSGCLVSGRGRRLRTR